MVCPNSEKNQTTLCCCCVFSYDSSSAFFLLLLLQCIVWLYVTFETPPPVAADGIDFIVDLNLRTFRCEPDNENHTTDLWQGILEENEDPRNIYFDHPIDESKMCTFPVELGMGLIQGAGLTDTAMTFETRNCPESMTEGKGDFCYGFSSSEGESEIKFLADA